MTQLKKIYFIYDADGGLWNEVKYWINKNLLKKASGTMTLLGSMESLKKLTARSCLWVQILHP